MSKISADLQHFNGKFTSTIDLKEECGRLFPHSKRLSVSNFEGHQKMACDDLFATCTCSMLQRTKVATQMCDYGAMDSANALRDGGPMKCNMDDSASPPSKQVATEVMIYIADESRGLHNDNNNYSVHSTDCVLG